jgi:ACS family tartrate transporter-like MFS transporter
MAGSSQSIPLTLLGLTLAASGLVSYMPPFFSLPSSFLSGTAAAGGIGLVSALGRIGAALGPLVVGALVQATGGYSTAMAAMACGQILAAAVVLTMGRRIVHPRPA